MCASYKIWKKRFFFTSPFILSRFLLHSFTHSLTSMLADKRSFSLQFWKLVPRKPLKIVTRQSISIAMVMHWKWLPPSIPLGNVSAQQIYNRCEIGSHARNLFGGRGPFPAFAYCVGNSNFIFFVLLPEKRQFFVPASFPKMGTDREILSTTRMTIMVRWQRFKLHIIYTLWGIK